MRFRFIALPAIALGVALFAAPVAQAATGSGMPGMPDMPGMSSTASAVKPPSLNEDIARSRQRPVYLEAHLAGSNEIPQPGKGPVGAPGATGTGIVRVQGDRVTFAFSWNGITAPTLGHIHQGKAGTNGPVVVPLFTTPMPANITSAAGAVTVSDPKIADELRTDPADFYLNLHDAQFAEGAMRGQLTPLTHPTDLLSLLDGGGERAYLSGDQEIPNPNGEAVGDPTGHAVAFLRARGTQIGFAFAWVGLLPTEGHIHQGTFGVDGPVVVPLWASAVPTSVFAVAGTVTGLNPALVKDIAGHPSHYYANLHTAAFPGGAARGQLFG